MSMTSASSSLRVRRTTFRTASDCDPILDEVSESASVTSCCWAWSARRVAREDQAAGAGDDEDDGDEADHGQHQAAPHASAEPVADAPHRGQREVGPELLAQLGHVDVDRPLVAVPVGAPDAVEQLLAREGEAGVAGQEGEQVELAGGQGHHLAAPAHLAAAQVDLEVAHGHDLLGGRALAGAAEDGADPRHELAGREGLDQVVVRPQLEAEDAVHLVVAGGEEQDGDGAAGPDLAADVEAVAGARQADVEDDDGGVLPREDLEAPVAVGRQQHAVALAPEVEVHQVGDVRVVLDDDHRPVLGAHGLKPRTSRTPNCRNAPIPHRTLTFGQHPVHQGPARWVPDVPALGDPATGGLMSTSQARTHRVRLGTAALASAVVLGAGLGAVGIGAGAAGAATATGSGNSGSTAVPPTLAGIKSKADAEITARVHSLDSASAKVHTATGLGSGQSTLASYLGADIAPLQQLNQTIQGDTTVQRAAQDFSTIFSGYRVYLLVLPSARIAADAFHATTTGIPQLTTAAAKAQGYVNPGNQAQLQPLIADLQSQIGAATSATNGLASTVLAFTPAQWNADHDLLSAPKSSAQTADAALKKGWSDVQQIRALLKGSGATASGVSGAA